MLTPENWDEMDRAWCDFDLGYMIAWYGRQYSAYHRLKIGCETDALALLLAPALGIDQDSDLNQAVLGLVRALRDDYYQEFNYNWPRRPDKTAIWRTTRWR